MIKGFEPSLFDKLFDDQPMGAARRRLSLEQLKDSVARDLEALLNTRVVLDDGVADDFPLSGRSVAGFGLVDFAGLSLSNIHDRQRICAAIESAIAAHEPRLREVKVEIELHRKTINALYFSINAVLVVRPAQEPVSFDALLQPTSLQYSISRHRRQVS
ncbi:MAG: type VI secretion system baseplate subunit TssE [Betaproteobacteria bacterium HGW-Betaproteobacteria-5]|jgi:type VI secretion system protein ImpF|nr:MAG: type VI secretion system baseplate subunit TssE [Betaproteobacteria bacterium HGW-Betaproteobacteria-5]PKO48432.1 MAG: type VI secretion system baseplate subunit TssE [Betaproteobacteria bacterium HGW-Betaproteobacteria-4]